PPLHFAAENGTTALPPNPIWSPDPLAGGHPRLHLRPRSSPPTPDSLRVFELGALPAALERPAARSANSSDSGGDAAADVGLAREEVDGDGDGGARGARRDSSVALACRSRSRWRGVPSDVTGTKPGARVVASICAEFPQLRFSSYVILARAPADWFRFRSTCRCSSGALELNPGVATLNHGSVSTIYLTICFKLAGSGG
ncbi:unnamed protein product, partial [Urochloa humidicola]